MFSSPSYSEWTKVGKNKNYGDTFYVDFERIRKHGGYVYFWVLGDYLKPIAGDLSVKVYKQGDCKLFRFKSLSFSYHKEPMGEGTGDVQEPVKKGWRYPSPNSSVENILKIVCSRWVLDNEKINSLTPNLFDISQTS